MFRPCNRAIVRLFNRDHQIDYIIGGFLGGTRSRPPPPPKKNLGGGRNVRG